MCTHCALLWCLESEEIPPESVFFSSAALSLDLGLIDPRGTSKKAAAAQTLVSIYQIPRQPERQEHGSTEMAAVQSDTPTTSKTHAIARIKHRHPHVTASLLLGWWCLEAPSSSEASVCQEPSNHPA